MSTQTQLPSARARPGVEPNPRGWRHSPPGTEATAQQVPAASVLSLPAPSTPEDSERLAWICLLFPTLGSRGRGYHCPSIHLGLLMAIRPVPGEEVVLVGWEPGAPSSVLPPQRGLVWGTKGYGSSRIGWAGHSSALSFAVPLRSKTNRKGKKKEEEAHLANAKSPIMVWGCNSAGRWGLQELP